MQKPFFPMVYCPNLFVCMFVLANGYFTINFKWTNIEATVTRYNPLLQRSDRKQITTWCAGCLSFFFLCSPLVFSDSTLAWLDTCKQNHFSLRTISHKKSRVIKPESNPTYKQDVFEKHHTTGRVTRGYRVKVRRLSIKVSMKVIDPMYLHIKLLHSLGVVNKSVYLEKNHYHSKVTFYNYYT